MFILKHKLQEQENNGEQGSGGGGETLTVEQLQAQLAEEKKQTESMRLKMDELLGETKKAKDLRRQAEEQAKIEAQEKAQKAGDYEQLHKSSESERAKLQEQLDSLQNNIAKEKEQSTAMRLASSLADGANAEILSEFVARRLKFSDNSIKVLDNDGSLTVSSLDQLKSEFESDARYKSLLKGSQSSGGGATGNRANSSTTKTATRSEFDAMNHNQRAKFFNDGGKLTN